MEDKNEQSKAMSEENLDKVNGGAYLDDNDLTKWKFKDGTVIYGHIATDNSTPMWTVKITITGGFVGEENKPWYHVRQYDQLFGVHYYDYSEEFLTGQSGEFIVE